mgnify:FL=1
MCPPPSPPPATNLCFAERNVYTSEVLAVVTQQLLEQHPLPVLLMRTVIQALAAYPRLGGFVMNVLSRLIMKQVSGGLCGRPSVHLCVRVSVCLSVCPSVRLCVRPSFHPSLGGSVVNVLPRLIMKPSEDVCPSVCLCLRVRLSVCVSICPSIFCLPIHPSVRPSICPWVALS